MLLFSNYDMKLYRRSLNRGDYALIIEAFDRNIKVCMSAWKIILPFIPQSHVNVTACSTDGRFFFQSCWYKPGLSLWLKRVGQMVKTSEKLPLFVFWIKHCIMLKWDSLFFSFVASSFSRGLRCRLRGPTSPPTRPLYDPVRRPPQRPCTPRTNQSWWPWHPCLSRPHRLHSTTSHRWHSDTERGCCTASGF